MNNEKLGDMLRELRMKKALTLEQVAKEIGATKAFVSLVENGRSGVSLEKAGRWAACLEVDADLILNELDPAEVGEAWERYLVRKYQPTQYMLKKCRELIEASGLPFEDVDLDRFYALVQHAEDDPDVKFFRDANVREVVKVLDPEDFGCPDWETVKVYFEYLVSKRGGGCDADYATWRKHAAELYNVKEYTMNEQQLEPSIRNALDRGASEDIAAGLTLFAASPKMAGAMFRLGTKAKPLYWFITHESEDGKKTKLDDLPFWHELARIIVDPELKLGRGAYAEEPKGRLAPYEMLLTRLAGWLALDFCNSGLIVEKPVAKPKKPGLLITIDDLAMLGFNPSDLAKQGAKLKVNIPERLIITSLIDSCIKNCLYVEAEMRLKTGEEQDKNAEPKLRVCRVVRSACASLEQRLPVQFNEQVPETSPIAQAWATGRPKSGEENLADWGKCYHLKGRVRTRAEVKDGKVRAIMTWTH